MFEDIEERARIEGDRFIDVKLERKGENLLVEFGDGCTFDINDDYVSKKLQSENQHMKTLKTYLQGLRENN